MLFIDYLSFYSNLLLTSSILFSTFLPPTFDRSPILVSPFHPFLITSLTFESFLIQPIDAMSMTGKRILCCFQMYSSVSTTSLYEEANSSPDPTNV